MSIVASAPRLAVLSIALIAFSATGTAQPARDSLSDSVGATFGEFRVDETGNASYTVPIYAPPGTAGVAPKIALTYNSGGGNGWIGRGWSISGLSAITRCRFTREAGDFFSGEVPVDGNSKPVSHTNQDAFCLDGARLLLVSGTYGASGAEYRPELDPFTKITSHGGDNSATGNYTGPEYFAVRRKDGSTSHYGNTADSRIPGVKCTTAVQPTCVASIVRVAWAVNQIEDSTGNYIAFGYTTPSATGVIQGTQYLPASVTWTGKRRIAGQSGPESAPYAGIFFHARARVPASAEDARMDGKAALRTRRRTS